jgi:hypothetical protein
MTTGFVECPCRHFFYDCGAVANATQLRVTAPQSSQYEYHKDCYAYCDATVFATAIFLTQLRAVAIFLSQLRATAAQFFAITGHSAIAVAPQLRRILTAIQNMGVNETITSLS